MRVGGRVCERVGGRPAGLAACWLAPHPPVSAWPLASTGITHAWKCQKAVRGGRNAPTSKLGWESEFLDILNTIR